MRRYFAYFSPSFGLFTLMLFGLIVGLWGCNAAPLTTIRHDFTDDSKNQLWDTEVDDFGQSVIAEGELYVRIMQPNMMQFATLSEPSLEDFVFSVDATLRECTYRCAYGILFRMQDIGSFYRFQVDESGRFLVERRNATGEWLRLTDDSKWGVSDAINKGEGAVNKLTVAARGELVIFQVNSAILISTETFDIDYGRGKFGLTAGTYDESGAVVSFDNVSIKEP